MTRQQIQAAYIRICRDSHFKMDWAQAAKFTADLFSISTFDIWVAFGDTKVMQQVAIGEHPATKD